MKTLIGAKTHFSLGESILSPDDLVLAAKREGYDNVMVADTNSISAMTMLFKAGKKHGVKIIMGITFNVVDDITWRKPKKNEPKSKPPKFHRPALYFVNEQGLKDAMLLLTQANDEDHYYYRPQISLSELCETVRKGNVIYASGSAHSVFAHASYREILDEVASAHTHAQMLLEICPVETPYYDTASRRAIDWARSFDDSVWRFALSRPAYYLKGQDRSRNTMDCILSRNKVDSVWRNEPADNLYIQEESRMFGLLQNQLTRIQSDSIMNLVIDNHSDVAANFHYVWDKMPISLPSMSATPEKDLVDLCIAGWAKRIRNPVLGYKPTPDKLDEYKARLKFEISTLASMGFIDYILLVQELTSWCKNDADIIVGPGRGSVGGSLVAFLIGITDVDPIRFGLYFERFINPERLDLPDIDLDFMASRRDEVIQYLEKEFGTDNVAGVSNYNMVGASSAIRSVGSAYNLTQDQVSCSKLVPKLHGQPASLTEAIVEVPEIEKFAVANRQAWSDSVALEGTLRSYGRHAAAVVVAGTPIKDRAVLENRQGHRVINWDKRVVEDFGLVKLDILGLQTLDLLSLGKRFIDEAYGVKVEYTDIPLDDEDVLRSFAKGDTVGVFQFESPGMRRLLKDLSHSGTLTFEEITATTALYRPGPMESGLMEMYVNIKQGVDYPNYPHPNMMDALKETDSVIVYQEQVMQIARDLAGYSMAEADHLRKAMGKKDKDAMAAQREQWVAGCKAKSGLVEEAAGALFDQVEKFAGYGFNKSHSVEYSVISYWSMWLKVKYPTAFFAAALTILGDDKMPSLVKDAESRGLEIMPPDINISADVYKIVGNSLYAPFQAVKGCSERGAQAIIAARGSSEFLSIKDFRTRVDKRSCNIRVQSVLDKIGAFSGISFERQKPAKDPSRLRDQKEFIGEITSKNVQASRVIELNDPKKLKLVNLIKATRGCSKCSLAGECHPQPRLGKSPKVMVVMDCPNWAEAESKKMGEGQASAALETALKESGMSKADLYITSLIKAPKGSGGSITNEMIIGCAPYLDKEIEILNPAVIIALGSSAIRHILPEVSGGWAELCGQAHYNPTKDVTVICGLNPLMVHFDSSKQVLLTDAFRAAKSMFDAH